LIPERCLRTIQNGQVFLFPVMPSHIAYCWRIPCQSGCMHAFVCNGADTRESAVLVGRDATVASRDITERPTNGPHPHCIISLSSSHGFWIGWLDLLHLVHSHSSGLQAIRRYRYSTHFTVHRWTCTRVLSLQ
jgi:hypothetical protein